MSERSEVAVKPRSKRGKVRRVRRIGAPELVMILQYLEEWLRGVHRGRLTWQIVEEHTGFSRQALSAKSEIASLYERVKAAQRVGAQQKVPANADERAARLQAEIDHLRSILDKYDDRWERIAYHCSARNIDLDELQMPLPALNRQQPRVSRRRLRSL